MLIRIFFNFASENMSNGMYEAAVATDSITYMSKPKRDRKMEALVARLHVKRKQVAPL